MEQQIAGAVIADNEDDVTLDSSLLCCQFPKVNTAQPIFRDSNSTDGSHWHSRHIVFTNRRIRLCNAFEPNQIVSFSRAPSPL